MGPSFLFISIQNLPGNEPYICLNVFAPEDLHGQHFISSRFILFGQKERDGSAGFFPHDGQRPTSSKHLAHHP